MRENRPLLRKFQSLREKKTMPAVLSAGPRPAPAENKRKMNLCKTQGEKDDLVLL
jgi:hypothetical protein